MTPPSRDSEKKSVGEMIAEMEDEMAAYRAADHQMKIWEQLFRAAPKWKKLKMLAVAFKELAGLSDKEIKEMFSDPLQK
jgi:hypothetical protein